MAKSNLRTVVETSKYVNYRAKSGHRLTREIIGAEKKEHEQQLRREPFPNVIRDGNGILGGTFLAGIVFVRVCMYLSAFVRMDTFTDLAHVPVPAKS